MLNSRHPSAKGSKSPASLHNFDNLGKECSKIAEYIFNLRDQEGRLLRNNRHKTVIWCFPFSIKSVQGIVEHLLKWPCMPLKYVLTYKFSQDYIELLFNKIRRWGGWINNPSAHSFKLALRCIIIRNGIELSQTGNCTNFDDALCESEGVIDFKWKKKNSAIDPVRLHQSDPFTSMAESVLIQNNLDQLNILQDKCCSILQDT